MAWHWCWVKWKLEKLLTKLKLSRIQRLKSTNKFRSQYLKIFLFPGTSFHIHFDSRDERRTFANGGEKSDDMFMFFKVIQWEWSNCMEVVLRLQIGELEKNDQHRSLVSASWHNSHHPQFLPSQNLAALPLSSKINAMLIFPHCRPCPPKYCSSRWLC